MQAKGVDVRAMWSGVVAFGLVSVPVRLYTATTNHDVGFYQVHEADGGRIRYRRFCEVCGVEVPYDDIVKGYEAADGAVITLTPEDMAELPVASSREIEVVEFVPAEQVDPLLLERSYYLEPDGKAVKPYALLREALRQADRMALVKVALRQRESLGLLRVRGNAIVLQTMLWPDEVREPDFETLRGEADLRPQELQMAATLVESLGADFDPSRFEDEYTKAVVALLDEKREHGAARAAPSAPTPAGEAVSDLLTALQRSVEEAAARSGRGGTKAGVKGTTGKGTTTGKGGASAATTKRARTTKPPATPAPARKSAQRKQAPDETSPARSTRTGRSASRG